MSDIERTIHQLEEVLIAAEQDGVDREVAANALEEMADSVRDGFTDRPDERGRWWQEVHEPDSV